MLETTVLKQYRAVCSYKTVFTSSMPVWAKDADDAAKIAHEKFEKHNREWIKDGGNARELLEITIKE